MSPAAETRRERRRLEIRERILEAAMALFETHGYESTTVNDVVEKADIAYGTFFNHFPSKLDLLRELSDRTHQRLFEDVEEIRKRPVSFSEHLEGVFESAARDAVAMGPEARDLIRAMMTLSYAESAASDDRRMRGLFRGLLEDGLTAGEVRNDVEVEVLVETVVGTWYSMFLSWVHSDGYPLRERAPAAARFLGQTLTDSRFLAD